MRLASQCLLIYPKDAQERAKKAKEAVDKAIGSDAQGAKIGDSWEPSTSASPAQRGN